MKGKDTCELANPTLFDPLSDFGGHIHRGRYLCLASSRYSRAAQQVTQRHQVGINLADAFDAGQVGPVGQLQQGALLDAQPGGQRGPFIFPLRLTSMRMTATMGMGLNATRSATSKALGSSASAPPASFTRAARKPISVVRLNSYTFQGTSHARLNGC